MGAIVNGLALHGFRAFGATFFTFSDYMRGAVRLSALMKLPSIWVYTHDSIGLGEDGPTHQPIEQLAALRAMPTLKMVRPADANETALAWRYALRNNEARPRSRSPARTCRSSIPTRSPTTRSSAAPTCCATSEGGAPELILIGTGRRCRSAWRPRICSTASGYES